MRFIGRAFIGLLIAVASVAVLALGVERYREAGAESAETRPKRPAPERVYTVRDMTVALSTVTPVTRAFGVIEAGRVLELRAAQPGRIVDLIPDFRDGAEVASGALLMRIDPANTESREADALAALADARSRFSEARQSAQLAEAELDTAIRQANIRNAALQRQRQLLERGIASRAALEAEQLALSTAEQTLIARRQGLATARNRIEQARLAVERAELSVSDARRNLADTALRAPFAGIVSDTNATLGRLVSSNETLGRLIDPRGLEVAFRLTDAQFARVLDQKGRILPLKARVSLALGARKISTDALLERAASNVAVEGGRTIYATLAWREGLPLRPGDFVSVEIEEPPLTDVAEVPARAATEDGKMFIIGEDGKLTETKVQILRRLQDTLIISGAPIGARIVAELRPQLGNGIKVQNAEEAKLAADKDRAAKAARFGGGKPGGGKPEGAGTPGGGKPEGAGTDGSRPEGSGKPEGGGKPAQAGTERPQRSEGGNS